MNPNVPDPTVPEADTSRPDEPAAAEIATGDRREEIHFEADPDQLVVARHLVRPERLSPEDPGGGPAADADSPPIEDVCIAPDAPSVWDARPPAEDGGERGESTDR